MDFGLRRAVLRATTGWRLYADGTAPTLKAAAQSTGSNIAYIAAAGVLLAAGNTSLLDKVRTGEIPLLAAAAQVKQLAKTTAAYKTKLADDLATHLVQSTPAERAAAARSLGADVIWDEMILPLIREDRETAPAE
jgi:hypothetical protein